MRIAIGLALGLIAIVTAWWAISTIVAVGGFQMSGHGWAALLLGVGLSLVLGIGLMALTFYSSRSGGDDPPGIDRS